MAENSSCFYTAIWLSYYGKTYYCIQREKSAPREVFTERIG